MAELVDALGLGSSGFICAGSSPVLGTYLHYIAIAILCGTLRCFCLVW
jgi:hypothetical protein